MADDVGVVNTSQVLPFTILPQAESPPGSGTFVPSKIDPTSVVVASEDETVMTIIDLQATADQIQAKVNPVMPPPADDPNQTRRFTIQADADPGPGNVPILGFGVVSVVQDPATLASTFQITFGAPVPKA